MKYYIVDDNIGTVKTLENIVVSRGIGTVCGYCTDPADALQEIQEDKPDIVLVDLFMDGMDGITLVNRIREKNRDIACVMISKATDKEMVQQAYTAGVEFFISKPVNVVEVENVLRNVAEKVKMKNIMGSIRTMFTEEEAPAPAQAKTADTSSAETLLGMLGMLGEKGTQDIRVIYRLMLEQDSGYNKDILAQAASELDDSVRNVEQRVRRAIKKGLTNAANAGIDDYGSDLFSVYATYVFDFKTLKEEMNYIEGKSSSGGRVNISRFMEGLDLYRKSL